MSCSIRLLSNLLISYANIFDFHLSFVSFVGPTICSCLGLLGNLLISYAKYLTIVCWTLMLLVCEHQWVSEASWRGKVLQHKWSWKRTWSWCSRRIQWKCREQCCSSINWGSWPIPNFGWQVSFSRTLLRFLCPFLSILGSLIWCWAGKKKLW